MSHNTRIRPVGLWVLGSVIDPAEMEAFDAAQYAEINGDAGGTWAPTSAIIIGGFFGLRVTGPFLGSDCDITITSTKSLTLLGGSTGTVSSGAVWNVSGTWNIASGGAGHVKSGASLAIDSGGQFNVAGSVSLNSGSTTTLASGGTLALNGTVTVGNGATVTCAFGSTTTFNGAVSVGSGGTFALATGSGATIANAATLACASGSTITTAGNLNLTSGGSCSFGAGSSLTANATAPFTLNNITTCNNQLLMATGSTLLVQSGATLTTQSGAAVTRGADETQTGKVVLSGNGAYTNIRMTLGVDGDHTYDGRQFDKLQVPVLTADCVYTFSDLGASDRVMILVERWRTASAHVLELHRGDGSTFATYATLVAGSAWIDWNGSTWNLVMAAGAVS